MSRENVAILRRGFEALFRGDWDAVLSGYDPDVEIRDHDVPEDEVYRGHEGFFAWLSGWAENFESWRIEGLEVRPVGEHRAIAFFRLVATGRASGAEVARDDAITYVMHEGKIVRQDYYNNRAEALEAVGLRE